MIRIKCESPRRDLGPSPPSLLCHPLRFFTHVSHNTEMPSRNPSFLYYFITPCLYHHNKDFFASPLFASIFSSHKVFHDKNKNRRRRIREIKYHLPDEPSKETESGDKMSWQSNGSDDIEIVYIISLNISLFMAHNLK